MLFYNKYRNKVFRIIYGTVILFIPIIFTNYTFLI